jgi:hypothetical protein
LPVQNSLNFVSIFYVKKVTAFSILALKKSGYNTFCAHRTVLSIASDIALPYPVRWVGIAGKKEQEERGFHKSLTDDLGEIIGGEVRRKMSLQICNWFGYPFVLAQPNQLPLYYQ